MTMTTYSYYYMGIIGRDGMYTYGARAATPELARLARGNLYAREGDRIGIYGVRELPGTWTDSAGAAHACRDKPVLVELVE